MNVLSLKDVGWYFLVIFQVTTYGFYAIYIHLCEKDGRLPFNATSFNFSIEFIKLITCFWCYIVLRFSSRQPNQSIRDFFISLKNSKEISFKKSLYFSIPGFCYCLNNNLGTICFQIL